MEVKRKNSTLILALGITAVIIILVFGTIWMGRSAKNDTLKAVHSVSLLYLDELAGRREQVVAKNLQDKIDVIETALELLDKEDLSSVENLQEYQAHIKKLFHLEKFAFVNSKGLIYTSLGPQNDIDQYHFDYKTISEPEISIKNLQSEDKKVIIAVPMEHVPFNGDELVVCFMEIDMDAMLSGVSMQGQEGGTTFCNIYTRNGIALSNTVLGGLAVEDNLLEAMKKADFDLGYSYEEFLKDFAQGRKGEVSFVYNGINETLCYVPVKGTDWFLTYLVRESVIADSIGSLADGIIRRSVIQSIFIMLVMLAVFFYVMSQNRKNAQLQLEKETSDAENRVKQEALEQRLALQEQLLLEERQREEQEKMIAALASDYWSVYYLDLDKNEGVCYQEHGDIEDGFEEGERFSYSESVAAYADAYVTDQYREEFKRFVDTDSIKRALSKSRVISYTYMVHRNGKDSYEMVKFAGVLQPQDKENQEIRFVGACFTNVDEETRKNLVQKKTLSDALAAAENASKAKTIFLSNMSHEIRTPMNAIIGLDNIALNDPDISDKTREYLEKIGGSAEHLLNLINDILDMSRIESGKMIIKKEEFSFRKLLAAINTIFSGQCSDHGLDYQCHINGQVDEYYIGDNMKLRQVLINILGNAVKFTPAGGKVELIVERLNQYNGKSTLEFKIIDTGIGMSEDFLPHIFETFVQEDSFSANMYGSSGLGLSITKNIVEMMNGTIEVESEKGKGSVFTVTVTLGDSMRKDSEGEIEEIRTKEMKVLIVDDDPVACEHARLILEKAGIASETAASGPEAIEMVTLNHTRRTPYNLILIDWKMPGMDGVETAREIRKIVGNESAIIILTAYRWDDVLKEALEAGIDSFIPKPLFVASLLEEFKIALRKKEMYSKKKKTKTDLTGRRILLAEDVQVNAEIILMLLEMRQMKADLAVNGKIAVQMFESHPEGYYDAILMDMRMPEMNGLEASKAIRSMDREDATEIPIIALTANAFDEDVQRSLQAGLNAHLSKPVQPDVLFETLESMIKDDQDR